MGQWSQCNIDSIIRVLDVFYHASGLRINMNKSNLMGISVDSNKVKHAAAKIGAIPIYHMFIFKVPMKVLQNMESIRACFFNGADVNFKKPSWVRWKSVLVAKDVGSLGAQFERLKEMVEGVTLRYFEDEMDQRGLPPMMDLIAAAKAAVKFG
nr:RNA-directed DNA polymerase, eukaryota, reverse transcriptase zinc-binding domain protein [Tanacetum cinerariifolium]